MTTPPPPNTDPHEGRDDDAGDDGVDAGGAGDGEPLPAVIIVTGACLRAERDHRPIAHALCQRVRSILSGLALEGGLTLVGGEDDPGTPLEDAEDEASLALVASDLWYLNHEHLRQRPAILVGGPERNAATAAWVERLPEVWSITGRATVRMAADGLLCVAACWGTTPEDDLRAAEKFEAEYLGEFLDVAFP